jgi:dodecin
MPESVYKVIELIGSSTESWEKASVAGLEAASKSLRDIRVAEVVKFDIHMDNGKPVYRAKLSVSFKYHAEKE